MVNSVKWLAVVFRGPIELQFFCPLPYLVAVVSTALHTCIFLAGASSWYVRIRLCMDPAWWSQWHLVGERDRVSPAPSVSSCRRLASRVQSQQHRGSHAVLFWSGESVAFIRGGKGQPNHRHDSIVLQSGKLNLLEPPGPVQGLFYPSLNWCYCKE